MTVTPPLPLLADPAPRRSHLWVIRIAIVAVFYAAVAPTLRWLDFYNAEENVVIASALEMRRSGDWLVPALQGRPRTIKPPLTVWVTTLGIRDATLRDMQSRDERIRTDALRKLAFEARWPTVLSTGLMLVGVFELARVMCGTGFGVVAACICGTCWYLLIRQGAQGISDLQLGVWVTLANVALAWMALRGRVWRGAIAAGVALALATMSKGPAVPMLQSLVPLAVFIVWRKRISPQEHVRIGALPFATIIALMLVLGVWWYVIVYLRVPDIVSTWWAELTRKGANDLPPDNWISYIRALRLMFPWLVWLVIGIAAGVIALWQRRYEARMLAFFLALVPLIAMNLFEERKERYLIPMIGPLAIVAAWPLWEHLKHAPHWDAWEKVAAAVHWLGLAAVAILMPIACASGWAKMRTAGGEGVLSWRFALIAMVVMTTLLALGLAAYARRRGAIVVCTVIIMLVAQAVYVRAFSRSDAGVNDMRPFADVIWRDYPDAIIYSSYPAELPGIVYMPGVNLSIYTARTIARHENPAELEPTDRPQIVLATSRKGEPEPKLPSSAWEPLGKPVDRRNGERWRLFLLPVIPNSP